jgi:predicted transposase/invertase (TIGR01784 family)
MKLFKMTVDFVFRSIFGKNPDILLEFLNAFPQFEENPIAELVVLNPDIPKEYLEEKFSILDIRAEDSKGNSFLIEMQGFPQSEFPRRALYYWAKAYSRNLGKGYNYDKLKKVYSFNFLNFNLFDHEEYLSRFQILNLKDKSLLTDDLEINIIELTKFKKEFHELQSPLDHWIYLLKAVHELKGENMKTLEKKSPRMRKAISELKTLSLSKKSREYYEMRRKAELDYNTNMNSAFKKGIQEGLERGIEKGKEQGIKEGELNRNLEIVHTMLSKNLELEFISEVTGLSISKIRTMKRTYKKNKLKYLNSE